MATRPPADRTKAEVLTRIRALVGALQRSARAIEQRTGVTNAQLFVLRQLADAESLSINELAALALTQQSTVSTLVARLARRGLVRRGRTPDDGRRVTVSLTTAGRKLLRHAPKPPTGRLIDALAGLGERELSALATGLAALNDAMQLPTRGATMLFEDDAGTTRGPAPRARSNGRRPR
jgi:MarR family transcriptional regulator, organic hydroperoxide resistance regulator